MADRKANYLVTLVFDENSDIRKQVDTEHAVKTYIRNGLQHAIVGKEIKHFVIADDEVINEKLTQERKVGKWKRKLIDSGYNSVWLCSECKEMIHLEFHDFKFCPYCGADMRGCENE